ncbi:hypothetical protein [Bacillus sp. 1P06AnD]|uniref:hypothetical protein n=1 Tax=Bacillus sp. 1P06AnD TaxID=3132208 RepID=UPI00399F9A78
MRALPAPAATATTITIIGAAEEEDVATAVITGAGISVLVVDATDCFNQEITAPFH